MAISKLELKQAIENGESVFVVSLGNVWEINPTIKDLQILPAFKDIYDTKAEAEHYLHHANITRTEQLPFLTWEEFNKDTLGFDFTDNIGNKYRCHIVRDYRGGEDFIVLYDKNGTISVDEEWEATEENFYKAYDECVRLFKGDNYM